VVPQADGPLEQVSEVLGEFRVGVVLLENLGDLLPRREGDVGNRGSLDALVTEFDSDLTGAVAVLGEFDHARFDGVFVDVAPLRWVVCHGPVRTGGPAAA